MFDEKTKETRTKKRHNDWKKAVRKRRITRSWGWDTDYYNNLHQYSKNKIHCSCPMCATKTRGKTVTKQGTGESWKISDRKRLDEMYNQLIENSQTMGNILDKLSDRWEDLSEKEQKYLANKIAGEKHDR